MQVREVELPGIGVKFSFETEEGETLCVVIHKTGQREIYRFLPGQEAPESVIELSDKEARELGAILIGTHFQPDVHDTARLVMKELTIEWLKIPLDSPLLGKSIQENSVKNLKFKSSSSASLSTDHALSAWHSACCALSWGTCCASVEAVECSSLYSRGDLLEVFRSRP